MTIYNTNKSSGGSSGTTEPSFGTEVGDIFITNKDNNPEKSIMMGDTQQSLDASLYLELFAKSGYAGEGAITSITSNLNTENNILTDSVITIVKNETEAYIISLGTGDIGDRGNIYKNTNNLTDISGSNLQLMQSNFIESSSALTSGFTACMKGDDIYIFYNYSLNITACSVYDTINNVMKSRNNYITSVGDYIVKACYYNKNMNSVDVLLSSSNETYFNRTVDGIGFNQNYIGSLTFNDPLYYNFLNINKNGNNFYYDGNYYILDHLTSEVYKISEIDFSKEVILTIPKFFMNPVNNMLQCTKNGVFFFALSRDDFRSEVQILYSDDGLKTYETRNIINPSFEVENEDIFYLIDDKTVIARQRNQLYINIDISQNDFMQILTTFKDDKNGVNTITKNNDKLNIITTNGVSDSKIFNYNFNITESDKPLLISPAPTVDDRYNWYVRAES